MISFTPEGVDCQVTIEVKDLDELITTSDLRQLDIFVTDSMAEKFLMTIFERCIDLISAENESKYENVH
jgi:hypothetical protein